MTFLTVWPETDPTSVLLATGDDERISASLADIGVEFSRWSLVDLEPGASAQDLLSSYSAAVEEYSADKGFVMVDAVSLARQGTDEEWAATVTAARTKFLSEHTHDDDEVRFFARGAGVFYLRIDGRVHAVLCTAGDLISVPQQTRHWFDMGSDPDFAAIRFFHEDDGWVGNFTEDPIASRFPDFDELASAALSSRH